MTIIGAFASFLLKKAINSALSMKNLINSIYFYIGAILYLVSALLNIFVLRFLEYSTVLPLTSITYVWTLLLAGVFLKEKITHKKIYGVMLIVIGAAFLV